MPSKHLILTSWQIWPRMCCRCTARIESCRDCSGAALLADRNHPEALLAADPGPVPDTSGPDRVRPGCRTSARSEQRPTLTVWTAVGTTGRPWSAPEDAVPWTSPPEEADRHLPFPAEGGPSRFSALLARRGSLLAVAAGMLTLLGLGGTVLGHLVPRDAENYAESAPANLDSTHRRIPHAAVRVSQTGTNYTPDELAAQIRTLLANTVASNPTGTGSATEATSPGQSPTTAGDQNTATLLTDPKALQSCLEAIGAVTPPRSSTWPGSASGTRR